MNEEVKHFIAEDLSTYASAYEDDGYTKEDMRIMIMDFLNNHTVSELMEVVTDALTSKSI